MLKRWFLAGVVLLVVSLLVAGCGVPQEEHDAVVAERDAAQAEVASLQSELAGVQSDLAATEDDLAAAESDLGETESDLATARSSISSLQSDLRAAQAKVSQLEGSQTEMGSLWDSLNEKLTLQRTILDYWNGAAWLGAGEKTESEYIIETGSFLIITSVLANAIGNAELSELWDDFMSYIGQVKEAEAMGSIAALTDLLHDLIDQDIAAIEAELSK